MRTRQADSYIYLFSSKENLRYIGTDADDVWGGEVFHTGFVDHVNEIPDWWFDETRAEAFERGEVGWAFLEGRILVDGAQKPMIARYTLVWAIEKGAWKLVKAHTSLPASNIETHGFEHHAMNALLAEVAKGFDLAQREGVATIVFTDIVGSSALAAATGDRNWAKRIAGHFDTMAEIVEAAGGEMVKSLGDGTMSSFSSTVAALSASRRMQAQTSEDTLSPPLKLRIGMHRGDVI